MTAPIAITRNGHKTLLKWHCGKRFPADTPFSRARIAEGLKAGASSEIDLQLTADGSMAVLHDALLEHSTTGIGPVATASDDEVRAARLLDRQGRDTGENVMLFDDLARLVAETGADDAAILQLDLKAGLDAFSPESIARFGEAVRPVARHMILSGGDAAAVRRLSQSAPGLSTGYDPCLDGAMETVMANGRYAEFVAAALDTAPGARMFYLHFELVFAAADAGFDMIAAFHTAGRTVDAWTIRSSDTEGLARTERLLALKADQITTDDADGLFAALG
nr:glycerophosphodiester phosphodiesterase family protein [Marinicella sp. W31]MDC2879500.1 glycerophosphodiester phosphodiesterase family protein [Marinicella sp. W31]